MRKRQNLQFIFRATVLALAFTVASAAAWAGTEWDVAELFFELNDTDGDLGLHGDIDGGPWKLLRIEAADKKMLEIRATSRLRQQGMTQLEFESAEPPFDELSPEEFFQRFPEGEYDVLGITQDGSALESEVVISHVLAAPVEAVVNGQALPGDCDEDPIPIVSDPVIVDWDPVTTSHPTIGKSGPVVIELYEFFLETEGLKLSVILPPTITEFEVPSAYLALSDEWKVEVIARTQTHNNTAIESCFEVD